MDVLNALNNELLHLFFSKALLEFASVFYQEFDSDNMIFG